MEAALAACKAAGAEEVPAIAHQLLVVSGPEPTVAAAALLVCPTTIQRRKVEAKSC